MIFVTHKRDEMPVFTGYVNSVWDRELPNGSKIHMYNIGTREKRQNGDRVHSSCACDFIGNARREAEINPPQKGDMISVYGVKLTNTSRKNEDGTWEKPFLRISISDYTIGSSYGQSSRNDEEDLAY